MAGAMVILAMLASGVVSERPLEMDDRRPIGNYWIHLQEIVKQFPPDVKAGSPLICDRLKHLRAKDLIRAATQGAAEARVQSTQDADRGLQVGVARAGMAFEFYPLLSEEDTDFNLLLPEIAKHDSEPAVRICLLRAMSDWSDSASSFSEYCTDHLQKPVPDMIALARTIAGDNSTHPQVACAAVEMGVNWLEAQYVALLREDSKWRQWIEDRQIEPSPAVFLMPDLPPGGFAGIGGKKLEAIKAGSRDLFLLCVRKSRNTGGLLQETAARALDRLQKGFPNPLTEESAQPPVMGGPKPPVREGEGEGAAGAASGRKPG